MNQSHVIDSWIAELALGAWSKPARPDSEVAAANWGREPARGEAGRATPRVGARPAGSRPRCAPAVSAPGLSA
jgi:hypothetical protein